MELVVVMDTVHLFGFSVRITASNKNPKPLVMFNLSPDLLRKTLIICRLSFLSKQNSLSSALKSEL
jgi:hypothetical protein